MTPPRDQPARDLARFELGRNVVVEAGAGAGKTTLLTDRLLNLLVAGGPRREGIDLTRLVALTFTEKAAGEIQVRLSDRLADLVAEAAGRLPDGPRREEALRFLADSSDRLAVEPARVAERAAAALELMDRAMIGTIHSFAARLLRLFPLEGGVDPAFEVDEGSARDELFESEWALWLDSELGEAAPRREGWLEVLAFASLADVAALARALCGEEARAARTGATGAVLERLRALAAFLRRCAARPGSRGRFSENALAAGGRLEALAAAAGGEGALGPEPDLEAPKASRWPSAWAGDPEEALYEEALAIAAAASPDSERLVRRAHRLVEPFVRSFHERCRLRGLVSFHGLLRQARDLVRRERAVREELKCRYSALLIDEFQDTDPLQGELLLYLAERPGRCAPDWRSLELEPGRLFVVGDPKQSIYRFRGADIRAYEEFTGLLLSQGALKCDLQTSFRSHAGVVEPVNAVHGALMREEAGLQPAYLPILPRPAAPIAPESAGTAGLRPARPAAPIAPESAGTAGLRPARPAAAAPRAPGLEVIAVGGEVSIGEARRAEAGWIARWVAESRARGLFRYKEVAILLRTTSGLEPYLDALKAAGIPYAVEADKFFYGTQEVLDLLNLLRVLDDPEDRLSLAGLLRSPLAMLDDRRLYELSRAGALDYRRAAPRGLDAGTRRRLGALWRTLRSLHARAGRLPLADLIAAVFQESFLVELASAAYYGEQTASNLLKLARLAAEAGEGRGATLKEFIDLVERSVRDAVDEGESPLADEHLDAVRILTIHKAKGLEWPVVILPNLAAPRRGGDPPPLRVDWAGQTAGLGLPGAGAQDAAMACLKVDEERREGREAVRLLYVAMTRAREHTILLGRLEKPAETSFAGLLAKARAWPAAEGPLALGGRPIPVTRAASGAAPAAAPACARGEDAAPRDPAGLARLWLARRREAKAAERPLFLSATRLAGEPARHAGPELPEGGALAGPAAALAGTVCHRVLEGWDFSRRRGVRSAVRAACEGLRRWTPAADWKGVAREAEAVLRAFLETRAARELARAKLLARELPFVYGQDGRVVRGALDLLCEDRSGLWVVDYKTDRLPARGAAAAAKERYGPQAALYKEAVSRALGRSCRFKLLFLRTGRSVEL